VNKRGALESGFTLPETLIVVAIVSAVVLFGASALGGSHAGTRSQTMAQVLGLFNRAHNLASANGATIQVAPSASGPGSDVTIFDAYSGGNAVVVTTTPERIGAYCVGTGCGGTNAVESFWLRVRRDGSVVGDAGGAPVVGATSITLGIVDGGQVLDAYTIDPTDLHASVAPVQ
jgi:prepilin-type N-terminal cleavage/methylation domain-containing protein